jgi:hypothetical protein
MKANTQKFLTTYSQIGAVENREVIGRTERLAHEKLLNKLNSDLMKFGSKITEEEFDFCGDLCCTWEDFVNCYINK